MLLARAEDRRRVGMPARFNRVGGPQPAPGPDPAVSPNPGATVSPGLPTPHAGPDPAGHGPAPAGAWDPFGIGAALSRGVAGLEAGGEILLGGAMIAVALLILLAQTGSGGAVARGVSRGAVKIGRKAIGAAVGGPVGAAAA